MTYMFKDRFKMLKKALKVWKKDVFGHLEFNIKACSNKLQSLELRVEMVSLSHEELVGRLEFYQQL